MKFSKSKWRKIGQWHFTLGFIMFFGQIANNFITGVDGAIMVDGKPYATYNKETWPISQDQYEKRRLYGTIYNIFLIIVWLSYFTVLKPLYAQEGEDEEEEKQDSPFSS